jgi:chromosomal replication initiation ATPase DnaA
MSGHLQNIVVHAHRRHDDTLITVKLQGFDPTQTELMIDKIRGLTVTKQSRPALIDVCRAICEYYNISWADLMSFRRGEIGQARRMAMYLSYILAGRSFAEIGRFMSRDHTTVMHAYRLTAGMVETNDELFIDIAHLKRQIMLCAQVKRG